MYIAYGSAYSKGVAHARAHPIAPYRSGLGRIKKRSRLGRGGRRLAGELDHPTLVLDKRAPLREARRVVEDARRAGEPLRGRSENFGRVLELGAVH